MLIRKNLNGYERVASSPNFISLKLNVAPAGKKSDDSLVQILDTLIKSGAIDRASGGGGGRDCLFVCVLCRVFAYLKKKNSMFFNKDQKA